MNKEKNDLTGGFSPVSEIIEERKPDDSEIVDNAEVENTEKDLVSPHSTESSENDEEITAETSVESKEDNSDDKACEQFSEEKSDEKISLDNVEYIESPFLKNQFLHFGFENDLDFIDVDSAFSYLEKSGFANSSLTQARERIWESKLLEQEYDPHKENCRFCDFCGTELTGVEYEIILDGRERCNECSRTVLKTLEEFKETFFEVRRNMETMFGIKIFASIDVKTMDARKLARKLNIRFTATPGFDGRVLGVAINEHGTYRLYVENQSPYLNAVATIAHELTHIWQYVNWDRKKILKKYGKKNEKLIYEGMAKWVEIQYLYFINEPERAYRELCATLQREDEYGYGLKMYLQEYDLSRGVNVDIITPFYDVNFPLHDA